MDVGVGYAYEITTSDHLIKILNCGLRCSTKLVRD